MKEKGQKGNLQLFPYSHAWKRGIFHIRGLGKEVYLPYSRAGRRGIFHIRGFGREVHFSEEKGEQKRTKRNFDFFKGFEF